jgi:hypothetical protein
MSIPGQMQNLNAGKIRINIANLGKNCAYFQIQSYQFGLELQSQPSMSPVQT